MTEYLNNNNMHNMAGSTVHNCSSPAGRTELVYGPCPFKTFSRENDHKIIAQFNCSNHPTVNHRQKANLIQDLRVNLVPARTPFPDQESQIKTLETLIVTLTPDVIDDSFSSSYRRIIFRPTSIEDPAIFLTLMKIRSMTCKTEETKSLYHEKLLRLLAFEVATSYGAVISTNNETIGGLSRRHTRLVTEHLAANFARAVPLEELAALVNLNRSYLCEAFRRSTGMAPHQFQTARRVDRAKQLLSDGDLSLAEIALATGYSDQSQFGAMFRKVTGSSPGSYRKAVGSTAIVARTYRLKGHRA